MGHTSKDEQGTDAESTRNGIDRRRVLQGVAAGTVTVAGLSVTSGSAVAQGEDRLDGNCPAIPFGAPEDFPTVDLTGDSPTASNVPAGQEEVVFFLHGWLEAFTGGAVNQSVALQEALAQNGKDVPVVAAKWPANSPNWFGQKDVSEQAGADLGGYLTDYTDANPDTTIRVVGHSLGGRGVYAMLDSAQYDTTVQSVSALGAAVNPVTVCDDGRFGAAIADGAEEVYNYHSEGDDIVCTIYDIPEGPSGVGCSGSDCPTGFFGLDDGQPDNYTDVDVTGTVENHCDYFRPDVGCVDLVVNDWSDPDDDGGFFGGLF
jgi:pimeloyl-ACP methyl ester carboxylesterase